MKTPPIPPRERHPLTSDQLDYMAGKACKNPAEGHVCVLPFLSKCHPDAGVAVSYTQGTAVLDIVCRECGELVCHVAVSLNTGLVPIGARHFTAGPEHVAPWFIGKFCKVPFTSVNGRVERMWVDCKGFDDAETLRGILDVEPFLAHLPTLEMGSEVTFKRADVVDVMGRSSR